MQIIMRDAVANAWEWTGKALVDTVTTFFEPEPPTFDKKGEHIYVPTPHGTIIANPGDFIVQYGDRYCDVFPPNIFHQRFAPYRGSCLKAEEIISDAEIERVHANADFGSISKRDVVNMGVLKVASGYYQGHTSKQIVTKHGLVNDSYELTSKGRTYLWAVFSSAHPNF